MTFFEKNKNLILVIFIILIINVVFDLSYARNSYLFGGDFALAGPPSPSSILDNLYVWNYPYYSGLVDNTGSITGLLYSAIPIIVFYISGLKYSILFYRLLLTSSIGSIGMFLLIYSLAGSRNKTTYFSAGIASLLFTLQFAGFTIPVSPVIFFPLVFLGIYLFIKFSYKVHHINLFYFSFLVLAAAFEIFSLGYNDFVWGSILLLPVFIVLTIYNKKLSSYILLALIFSLLINFSYLFSTYQTISLNTPQLNGLIKTSQSAPQYYYYPIVKGILAALYPLSNIYRVYQLMPLLVVVIVSILSVLIYTKNKNHDKVAKYLVIGIFLSYLMFLSLATLTHSPGGPVFSWLYKHISFFVAFRYVTNFSSAINLLTIILFGIGSFEILNYFSTRANKFYCLTLLVLLIIVIYWIYLFAVIPINQNVSPTPTLKSLKFVQTIPNYTINIANYINKNVGYYSVATLPSDQYWHLSKWYDAVNIYTSLINAPVYSGGATENGEFFYPDTQYIYSQITEQMQNSNESINMSKLFSIFGIKYIIIEGNSSNTAFDEYHYPLPFNFRSIYNHINSSNGLVYVSKYANSSIYMNTHALKLIYPSQILCVNYTNATQIINFMMSNTNINKYSIYSSNVLSDILDYGKVQIYNVSEASFITKSCNATTKRTNLPVINFSVKSPTLINAVISNATTPYYLVFRETYDPHWAAFYSNGTQINSRNHIAVNGFANAWYMNKTGNYTINIYYTLQTYAWIAWVVSFAAFGITVYIGYLGFKKSKLYDKYKHKKEI
ncbi:MAG: hypothetical protein QXF82_07985 [Nitrososphaeria archaeon]